MYTPHGSWYRCGTVPAFRAGCEKACTLAVATNAPAGRGEHPDPPALTFSDQPGEGLAYG
jgi:hypothetical protein